MVIIDPHVHEHRRVKVRRFGFVYGMFVAYELRTMQRHARHSNLQRLSIFHMFSRHPQRKNVVQIWDALFVWNASSVFSPPGTFAGVDEEKVSVLIDSVCDGIFSLLPGCVSESCVGSNVSRLCSTIVWTTMGSSSTSMTNRLVYLAKELKYTNTVLGQEHTICSC